MGTLQAKVTSNMNLKEHDQNSGHPTQAISQRVAMKQSSVTILIVKENLYNTLLLSNLYTNNNGLPPS